MVEETFPLRTLFRAFPGIPVDEARALIRKGVVKSYPQDIVLCLEDAFESVFYIVLDGKVKVTKKVDPTGAEVRLLKMLGPGDFFGEMALIQNAPRAATVTSVEPCSLLEIDKEDFDELLGSIPSLSQALMHAVARRLRENDQMAIEDLRIKARELADAYQRLAEFEFARREFLTTIAHELRTPLTAAGGFLHLVEMGLEEGQSFDNATLRSAMNTASRHVERIISLVNDILFVQEMDLILPHFEATALEAVARAAISQTLERHAELNVNIDLKVQPALPPIWGNAASLQRAFEAVIDNAIKFSHPNGHVQVSLAHAAGLLLIEVCDQGIGISEETLPRVFDRFFHVDRVGGRLYGGVGLGLSISRQVIEQHNGKISLSSRPGEGTIVRIELLAQPQA